MDMSESLSCTGNNMIISSSGSRLGGGNKLDDEAAPPALPPRPPPRPRNSDSAHPGHLQAHLKRTRVKKYVFLCSVCGGLASLLGTLFLAVYLILRTYTSSLDYFETIPTYIPAAMLMITGLAVMCLARRRNRYIFLIKLCGLCCLMCVGTCVLVTVTTTVVHMSRLQSLRECVYTLKTQTCTCYSVLLESASERTDEGSRYVFNTTPDCEAIHGALYSCLRALFGLSVIGILVCIFCCMLVYQLLSHERKKMYWEQLELRCRYLYGQASNPSRTPGLTPTQATQHCACCQQFRYQQDILAWEPSENRFWNGGQVGNLYTPNPVGDEPVAQPSSSGWSWRRLPWSRQPPSTLPAPSNQSSAGYHQPLNCSSPDSQYGFSSDRGRVATVSSSTASYTVIDPVISPGCHVYHWGPPPPYSDPNSPSRGVLCPPGPHHHHCQQQRGNYVNTDPENDSESVMVELRLPSRRLELPLSSSSSSSVKSDPRVALDARRPDLKPPDPVVSSRIKYIHNKLQNTSNPSKKQAQEQSESEVYFADVSSCNMSVRNDSMSIYGEAFDNKRVDNLSDPPEEALENQNGKVSKKHTRSTPSDEKNSHFQIIRPTQDISQTDEVLLSKESKGVQRSHGGGELSCSEVTLDCSEDDDPELVSFSQRQSSMREHTSFHYRNGHPIKGKNDTENQITEMSHKNQNNFPSPMSISSPSSVGKGNGGFYTEVVNSDNGSSDSVWSGYSPDLLAPDAQYEVIPEHRLTSSEDFNGNPNDWSGNRTRAKCHPVSKKRLCSQMIGDNWSNNVVCSESKEFSERQKFSGYNINSPKNMDKSKDQNHKSSRSNERCLADILNSPKLNYKNSRQDHPSQSFSEPRRNDLSLLCDHSLPVENMGGFYYSIGENDNVCCERAVNESYEIVGNDKSETQNCQSAEAITNTPKSAERVKLNTNLVNSLEPTDNIERSESSCKCNVVRDV